MVIRIDNRPTKHRGRNITLVCISILFVTGFVLYENFKPQIIQNVNEIKETAVSQVGKINQQNNPVITNQDNQNSQVIQDQPNPVENTQTNQQSIQQITPIDPITLENQIHEQINIQRKSFGLQELSYDSKLASIAREHSKDMSINNYFDHISPTGQTLQDRLNNANYPCFHSAENIQENYVSTPGLVNSIITTWMESQGHKNNILSNFNQEGIGVFINGDDIMITENFC